jgi:peptidoglycan/LPS O-acetylase OafA/YrhL
MTNKNPINPKNSRLFFADHLRAALVILVVLHHIAMVYGGIQPFYYLEPPASLPAFLVPMVFVLLNQGWFMGALFLLAGYFTPGSYDRKGAGTYLKDRLIRLGIPMVVFYFVLSPISGIGYFLMNGGTASLTWDGFLGAYPDLIGLGPLWFVAMLLIFDFGYVAWRLLAKKQSSNSAAESSVPTYLGVGIFVLALALVSYLVRIVIPLGKSVLDFPTLAYLPQYLSFFIIGTIAYHRDWLRRLPGRMGVVGFVVAILASITLFALGFVSFLKALENASPQIPPWGFGTWQSAVYVLWDSIFAVGMTMAAITFFRRFFNRQSRFGTFLAQQSYAVYVIHIPIVVFLTYALRGIALGSLLKFGIASLLVVTTCFVVAFILRKIPGVSRVL